MLTRRDWLTATLAAGATGSATGASGSSATGAAAEVAPQQVAVSGLRFPSLQAELEALIRVEGNLAPIDNPVWFYWTAFAITPGISPTPVVSFEGLELSRAVRRSDGSYFVKGIDLSFPRDHRTGEFTSTARHPVTGATIDVPVSAMDGSFDPGYVVSTEVGWWPLKAEKPAVVNLNTRWWRENASGRLQRERTAPPGFPKTFIEAGYYEFSMADFENPAVTAIPYRTSGVYVFPFPKWMDMGERPGHMLGMITGRKLRSVKELPEPFLRRAEKEHPALLSLDTMFRTVPQP
jgi:hypothetical protein